MNYDEPPPQKRTSPWLILAIVAIGSTCLCCGGLVAWGFVGGSQLFEQASSRLQAAGVGSTEVLPLERVLDAPQARHPGKLRDVAYRGLGFQVPEFPRLGAARDVPTQPPAELGAHTIEVLLAAGVAPRDCDKLVTSGAAAVADPQSFAWAAVRQ